MPDDLFFQVSIDGIDPHIHIFRRITSIPGEFETLQVDCYVIETKRFIVLCDTSLCPQDSAALLQTFADQAKNQQVIVINSHADWDHVWGNGTFANMPVIPIIAHDNALARWQSDEMLTLFVDYRKRFPLFHDVVLTQPQLTFNDTLTLYGGDLTLELFHAPGHQPDHIAIWIAQLQLLLAFDAVEYPFPTVENARSVPVMLATLRHLLALAPQTVLCSHGGTISPSLVQDNLDYMNTIEQKCRVFLADHSYPTASALEHASALIGSAWQDAVPADGVVNDQDYSSWAHDQNVRAVMQWIGLTSTAIE